MEPTYSSTQHNKHMEKWRRINWPKLQSTFAKASLLGLLKSIIIILLGWVIFYVDDKDFFDYKLTIGIIMLISVLKCAYFIGVSYQKIIEVSLKNIAYHKFMSFMALNMIFLIRTLDYKLNHYINASKHLILVIFLNSIKCFDAFTNHFFGQIYH